LNPLQELKSWILGNLVLILGVALALTALYAGWLRLVSVPAAQQAAKVAQANAATWEANTNTCLVANKGLSAAVERQNDAVTKLATIAAGNKADLRPILEALSRLGVSVKEDLARYSPDKGKSDCQNAKDEVNAFRRERGY
jgi:hypothetical protein